MRPLSLKGHERPLTRVRINEDGDLLFTGGKDKFFSVWYMDNGERLGTYEGHDGAIFDIDVKWDSSTLVSASGDYSMKAWDVETGKCWSTVKMESVVRSITLSYSGNLAAFTTQKTITKNQPQIIIVDLREPPADSMAGPKNFVFNENLASQSESCLFSHLDDIVITGCQDGSLQMYDLRNPGDVVNFSCPHNYSVTDLQLSRDQGFVISSSQDKTAQLHNAKNLEKLKTYRSGRPVNSAAISPIRDHIVLGGGEEAIKVTHTHAASGQFEAKLYHLVYEEEFALFKGHFGPINSLAYNPAGTVIVSGGEDGYVRIQELDKEYLDFEFDY